MIVEKYKLFENLAKAKKILNDLNSNETNPKFLELKELLKNNMGYLGQFTKWYLKDNEPLSSIEEIYKMALNTRLDKPIDEFDRLEDMYDYIQEFEINKKVNQVIKSIPSKARELVNSDFKRLIASSPELSELLIKWYSRKGGKYKDIKSLYADTVSFINNNKGDFNLETMKNKIKNLNVDIIVDTDNLLLLRINDYAASAKIGSKSWCIVTSKNQWDSYVNVFTTQYFVYDFTKDRSDKRHMIGFTISPAGEIKNSHWADDTVLSDKTYLDNL